MKWLATAVLIGLILVVGWACTGQQGVGVGTVQDQDPVQTVSQSAVAQGDVTQQAETTTTIGEPGIGKLSLWLAGVCVFLCPSPVWELFRFFKKTGKPI